MILFINNSGLDLERFGVSYILSVTGLAIALVLSCTITVQDHSDLCLI